MLAVAAGIPVRHRAVGADVLDEGHEGADAARPVVAPPREAYQVVADELMLDGNARQNLATFCQTWAEPELLALMAMSIHKNMIDKDEYPQTAEIEARCVHMLADLWNAPDAGNAVGASCIGSSNTGLLAGIQSQGRGPG